MLFQLNSNNVQMLLDLGWDGRVALICIELLRSTAKSCFCDFEAVSFCGFIRFVLRRANISFCGLYSDAYKEREAVVDGNDGCDEWLRKAH